METERRRGYSGTARRKGRQQTTRTYDHRATSRLYREYALAVAANATGSTRPNPVIRVVEILAGKQSFARCLTGQASDAFAVPQRQPLLRARSIFLVF